MFKYKDSSATQLSMFDSLIGLTAREMRFLEKSWAKPFADYVFPAIDQKPFEVLYSDVPSRANTPVNVILGALILQQLTGQSDDEILNSLLFDIRFQYALHTTNDQEQPLSDRTLGRFRARCIAYEQETGIDLIHDAINSLNDQIAEMMKIDHSLKRMDSMMINANIRRMNRLDLIYTCTSNLAKILKSAKIELSQELLHYTEENDRNKVIYHSRTDAVVSRIEQILKDAKIIKKLCEEKLEDYESNSQYLLFVRMLNEQTTIDTDGNYQLKQAKSKQDNNTDDMASTNEIAETVEKQEESQSGKMSMDSNILQNPSDPDATFRSKNGSSFQGYAANITEESTEDGKYSIITSYQYDTNNTNDQTFCKQAIEELKVPEEGAVIVADGLFHGKEIEEAAADKNIEIINTNLSGRSVPDIYADFKFNEEGTKVTECPNGIAPHKCSYNEKTGQCIASFHSCDCKSCPFKDQCKPKINSKTSRKTISVSAKVRAEKQRFRSSAEFSKYSNYRNGVETVPSFFRSYFHVDRMPVRGKLRTKLFFGCMVAASNVMKFCNYISEGGYYAQNTVNA